MTLTFTPSAFAPPYTMITASEAAAVVTVALYGPAVFQHQTASDPKQPEMQAAQEAALRQMYELLRDGDLVTYVEDPRGSRFLRVPTDYYLDEDVWGFGRCFALTSLFTGGIPPHLEDAPVFFLKSEIDQWVAHQARRATAKRGPKPKYDAESFIATARQMLEEQGGYVVGEFDRPALRRHMQQWCMDNWDVEPGESWVSAHIAKAEQQYDAR